MRKNIYDRLIEQNLDLRAEYERVYNIFYSDEYLGHYYGESIEEIVDQNFKYLNKKFIKRCLSLSDFNETFNYDFKFFDPNLNIDQFINLCEYVFNFIVALIDTNKCKNDFESLENAKRHIISCLDEFNYTQVNKDGIYIFVEKNSVAISVSEVIDETLAYSVLEYNHHRLKGNLIEKCNILKNMADYIEPKRKDLSSINKKFSSDLFQLLNKFVRHSKENNEFILNMSHDDLENVYDEIYQMWLLAIQQLEFYEKKDFIDELLSKIN